MEYALLHQAITQAPLKSKSLPRGEAVMLEDITQINVLDRLDLNEADIEPVAAKVGGADRRSANSLQEAGAEPQAEFDAQASLLLGLIHDFKSLTDRACDMAVREAQHSAQVEEMTGAEITSLRLQLKERDEALDTRERSLREREAVAREKIDSLEMMLRDKDAQLESCHGRARSLLGEIDGLDLRLKEAAAAMKQAEMRFRDFAEHQHGKINELRHDANVKEQTLLVKEAALKHLAEESHAVIGALETQLHDAARNLKTKETELREKEAALQAATAREQTFAQLMQQLAAESQKLMAELREKNQMVSELEKKPCRSFDDGIAWRESAVVQERLL
jgi:chromosome segregation ATPase